MKKLSVVPKPEQRIGDGVSKRVRFANHEQFNLVKAAAKRRGVPRDRFIQDALQAVAECVMAQPEPPSLAEIARNIVAQQQ